MKTSNTNRKSVVMVLVNATMSAISKMFDQTLVSDESLSLSTLVVDTWASLVVAFVGIFTNALTIVVYSSMGFGETVNITMTTIAFWDMVRVLCGSIHRCYGPISLVSESLGKSWQNITTTNLVYLHNIASNIAYAVGSYVALERCLCVSFPLKIKLMVSPKLTFIICTAISVIVFAAFFPSMLFLNYRWVSSPANDRPTAVYEFSNFYKQNIKNYIEFYQYINFAFPMVSLVIMVISTLVISYQLKKSSRFRASSQVSEGKVTSRESQVVKMLLLVIASYITVLLPRVAFYIAELIETEFFVMKYYNNPFFVVVYLVFFLDFINSSIGIVIFYTMSSKFRKHLRSILACKLFSRSLTKHNSIHL